MNKIEALIKNKTAVSILLVLIAALFYYNAIPGEYVLDDGLVLNRNEFVKKGFSGIPDILTHDSFYGSVGKIANLNGGRYRPLALVTYAIEYQFYGLKPEYSRAINVLLYMLTAYLIFQFLLKFIFINHIAASFITCLLFVIHPIHTEVVANIKSRDEILSLIFILLTLHFLFDYIRNKKSVLTLFASLCFFLLALLSKENGIILLALVPITLVLLLRVKGLRVINISLLYWLVIGVYLAMRLAFVGFQYQKVTELMDNPYMLASIEQKYATIMVVLLKYLQLFFYPHPLSYDYSYNQIPYTTFTDPIVWLSIFIHIGLIAIALLSYRSKPLFTWCIAFHLAGIFIVSNIVINIGAPMGERFLYQSSLFLIIGLVYFINELLLRYMQIVPKTLLVLCTLTPIFILSFIKTHARNEVWLVGTRLGLTDVKTVPNSARALTYAGINLTALSLEEKDSLTKRQMLEQAIIYLDKALQIHPYFGKASQAKGLCYFHLKDYEKAGEEWLRTQSMNVGIGENVSELLNAVAQTFFYYGMKAGASKDYNKSIANFYKAIRYKPDYAEAWYNMGGAYFTISRFDSAKICFENALRYKPDMSEAAQGLNALSTIKMNK